MRRRTGLPLVRNSHTSGSQRSEQSGRSGFSQALSGAQDYAGDIADRTMDTVGAVASTASDDAARPAARLADNSLRVAQQAQSTFEGTVSRILQPLRASRLRASPPVRLSLRLPRSNADTSVRLVFR